MFASKIQSGCIIYFKHWPLKEFSFKKLPLKCSFVYVTSGLYILVITLKLLSYFFQCLWCPKILTLNSRTCISIKNRKKSLQHWNWNIKVVSTHKVEGCSNYNKVIFIWALHIIEANVNSSCGNYLNFPLQLASEKYILKQLVLKHK